MSNQELAVLIDADNAQAAITRELLTEIASYGTATVKRAYGDWTTTNLGGWKETLHQLAIQPIQQFRFTVSKNADGLSPDHRSDGSASFRSVDGFCLVSSDSDFTRLAARIREAGLSVYGFGEGKTPTPFVAACDKFIFTELLRGPTAVDARQDAPSDSLQAVLFPAITAAAKEDG